MTPGVQGLVTTTAPESPVNSTDDSPIATQLIRPGLQWGRQTVATREYGVRPDFWVHDLPTLHKQGKLVVRLHGVKTPVPCCPVEVAWPPCKPLTLEDVIKFVTQALVPHLLVLVSAHC